jgi:hypothetical protein
LFIFGVGYELGLILLLNETTYNNFTIPQNNIVMEGIIFILYFGLALLVGLAGKNRIIGFGMAFVSAIFLTPLIGIVIVLLSKTKKERKPQK